VNQQQPVEAPQRHHPRDTPRHARANTVVEDQLNYISGGPFPEELKQALITVCAVLCTSCLFDKLCCPVAFACL
jgi:hypothetical protein